MITNGLKAAERRETYDTVLLNMSVEQAKDIHNLADCLEERGMYRVWAMDVIVAIAELLTLYHMCGRINHSNTPRNA